MTIIGSHGVRHSRHEVDYARASGIRTISLGEVRERGLPSVREELAGRFDGPAGVYVSFDIDVVDPSDCPGQKYPEAAGLSGAEAVELVRAVSGIRPLAGFDVCCFAPRYDEGHRGALLAARLALEAVYACARHARARGVGRD